MSSIIFWPILKMCKMCHIWKASSVSKGIWCITCLSFLCNFYLNASLCISNFSKGMEKFLMLHTVPKSNFLSKISTLLKNHFGKIIFWKKRKNWEKNWEIGFLEKILNLGTVCYAKYSTLKIAYIWKFLPN